MRIHPMPSALLLCWVLLLSACKSNVSPNEETIYGTFSTSQAEQDIADKAIRDVIEFSEGGNGKVVFIEGYTILNQGTKGSLYLGVYTQEGKKSVALEDWAKALQQSNKQGWTVAIREAIPHGETIYDATLTNTTNPQRTLVAVSVEYNRKEGTYWIYIAVPDEMLDASRSDTIKRLFDDYRRSKK